MTQRLPFFVYGTLMKGFRNFNRHVSKYESLRWISSKGNIFNANLVHFEQGYPGMYHGDGIVYGEVIIVDDQEEYNELLNELDQLEEYFGPNDPTNEYDRMEVDVHYDDKTIRAWAYFCRIPIDTAAHVVSSGDWRAFMIEFQYQDIHADET